MGAYWSDFVIFDGFFADFKDAEDAYNAFMVIVCVVCAGLAAGLTVGLLSLDETKLEIKVMIGTEEEKRAASSILPIIKQHHLLLVTLLLFNSIANETLPIFLGTLVPNYIAIILSVTLVLIFGEIIPTALFTGANQLLVAAKLTKMVYALLILFYPIAFPIAKLLDYCLGADEGDSSITREELEALVVLQGEDYRRLSRENSIMKSRGSSSDNLLAYNTKYNSIGDPSTSAAAAAALAMSGKADKKSAATAATAGFEEEDHKMSLSKYEVNLMTGILKLSKFTVKDAMIPIRKVFMISSSTKLDEKSLYDILDSGFSRIPVFKRRDKQSILGYLLVKELIVLNPMDAVMIEDLSLREPICVKPTIGLMDMLRTFQEGQCHLALVSLDPIQTLECLRNDVHPTDKATVLGIVTMEDILEMIIQSEIIDETDAIHNNAYLMNGSGSGYSNTSGGNRGAPTIFYHNLRRYSHSNLAQSTASYPGTHKTSKGGIRIQQPSLKGKRQEALVMTKKVRRRTLTTATSVVQQQGADGVLDSATKTTTDRILIQDDDDYPKGEQKAGEYGGRARSGGVDQKSGDLEEGLYQQSEEDQSSNNERAHLLNRSYSNNNNSTSGPQTPARTTSTTMSFWPQFSPANTPRNANNSSTTPSHGSTFGRSRSNSNSTKNAIATNSNGNQQPNSKSTSNSNSNSNSTSNLAALGDWMLSSLLLSAQHSEGVHARNSVERTNVVRVNNRDMAAYVQRSCQDGMPGYQTSYQQPLTTQPNASQGAPLTASSSTRVVATSPLPPLPLPTTSGSSTAGNNSRKRNGSEGSQQSNHSGTADYGLYELPLTQRSNSDSNYTPRQPANPDGNTSLPGSPPHAATLSTGTSPSLTSNTNDSSAIAAAAGSAKGGARGGVKGGARGGVVDTMPEDEVEAEVEPEEATPSTRTKRRPSLLIRDWDSLTY